MPVRSVVRKITSLSYVEAPETEVVGAKIEATHNPKVEVAKVGKLNQQARSGYAGLLHDVAEDFEPTPMMTDVLITPTGQEVYGPQEKLKPPGTRAASEELPPRNPCFSSPRGDEDGDGDIF